LEPDDPDFVMKRHIIRKFFSLDPESPDKMDISSKHFKLYFQKLNTKILKFIKILNFNPDLDDFSSILESRSLSLEYLSFQRLKTVYENFLHSFPTSLSEDAKIMKDKGSNLTGR
jgi:hypothetical protein